MPISRDSFVRAVDVVDGGTSARPAINITGLAEGGTATFPADGGGVSIAASFAEVLFPPGVGASPVPAGGLLVLRVSDRPPAAADIAASLGIDPAGLEVRRVVEAGGIGARIVFDMPVRVLLAGQAGGTAFYADGEGGVVVPIFAACAADSTAAVHAQLGGAGECQIDVGGDKAVHTYHLTLLGTAAARTELQAAVAAAASGGTVGVPAGTYAAGILTVDKPLTIEPADPSSPPVFTGYAHIVVRPPADGPVTIRGLVFEDTAHTSGGEGLASIVVESAAGSSPGGAVRIENNTFRNTCDTAVRAAADAGAPPISGLAVEGNRFYDIGGNRDACAASPNAPERADAIVAGRHGPFTAGTEQLANVSVRDNYVFGTTYTGMRIAGADGLVVEGNHIEGVPDDGIRILPSRNVAVRDNTIVGANSALHAPDAHDGAAGAAIEVWAGSAGVAVTLNRVSGSAGAFSVCAGTCDPGADAADGTGGLPVPVSRVPVAPGDMRFNHNVLAGSNTGDLVANNAGGTLDARANYYPGYAASAAGRAAPAGAVLIEPALDAAGLSASAP